MIRRRDIRDMRQTADAARWQAVELPTDTSGPPGTYGCACVSRNAFACAELRCGYSDQQERCECLCHNWEDDDEDGESE